MVDEDDFDDAAEKQMIAALSQSADNPMAWQAECIVIWRQFVEAAAEFNRMHPNQQTTIQQQYPELFEYLADSPDTVLMPWETENGVEDLRETITAREVLMAERLQQQEGRLFVTPDLEQYVAPGGGMAWVADTKQVPHQGVPILHYEKGLFATVLDEADYGESDLMDNQHTLFLKDLSDQHVYDNTCMLEQVTDLVRRKMIKQLPEMAWEVLRTF